jgi:hypothetical protein
MPLACLTDWRCRSMADFWRLERAGFAEKVRLQQLPWKGAACGAGNAPSISYFGDVFQQNPS